MTDEFNRDPEALYKLARALHRHNLNRRKLLSTTIAAAGEMTGCQHGCIITFHHDGTTEDAYILDPNRDAPQVLWESLLERGLIGYVYHGARVVTLRDLSNDPRWPHLSSLPVSGSAIGLPLETGHQTFGVLVLLHPAIDYFSDAISGVLGEIAELASMALASARDYTAAQSGEARYHHLFTEAVVPMLLSDLDGGILDINREACDFFSYDQNELVKAPVSTVHPTLELDEVRAIQPGEERIFRTTAFSAEGSDRPVIVRVRRVRLGAHNALEWVEQDATPQMELEQLRRDLTAMVYHDLRGPLHTINSGLQKLAHVLSNHENPAVLTLLQMGTRATRQLRRMIDSLLDIQRMEEGNAILNLQPVELRVVLADAVQLVQPLAWEAGQELKFDLPTHLPAVLVDNEMMVRVVVNLLENAVKYTPGGGMIRLSARIAGNAAFISVKDSGPGIPAEMLTRIFDKFSRVKYHDAPKGLGLGLAFCRLAIAAHGGSIWVESEVGRGSEFLFTLPLMAEAGSGGAEPALASV
jgi:PAS domain S-box-containing protein